jgi:phage/plasmid primase-like uncharacterized protein
MVTRAATPRVSNHEARDASPVGDARYESAARAIESAVAIAIRCGRATRDVGGDLGTAAAGQAIVEILQSDMAGASAAAR